MVGWGWEGVTHNSGPLHSVMRAGAARRSTNASLMPRRINCKPITTQEGGRETERERERERETERQTERDNVGGETERECRGGETERERM